jgi:MFS family permease
MSPMLLLALVGGAIADSYDRRRILVFTQAVMMSTALGLAWAARSDEPQAWILLAMVSIFGIAGSLGHPAMATIVPSLVRREDLSGAISLQSTQMNFSRVVGPAIGGLILPLVTTSGIFLINAVTYLFFIGVIFAVPRPPRIESTEAGWHRLLGGFRAARADPVVGRSLITMTVISLLCLPFVGLLPVLAAENLKLDLTGDPAYGFFYACFGVGATAGAFSVGTWLSNTPRHRTIRWGLAGWSVTLALFGVNRSLMVGFVLATIVGGFYFVTVTSINTLLHEQVADEVRGRVMALWMMAWGGTVPFGLMIGGQIAEMASMTVVTLYGAFFLAVLAAFTQLDPVKLSRPRQTVRGRARVH